MGESDQFVPLVNCLGLVPAVRFEPQPSGASTIASFPASDFVLTSPTSGLFELYLKQAQANDPSMYVSWVNNEHTVQNALDSLNRLFAYEPCQVIEAFADYICQPERYAYERWNRPRQELVSCGTVSPIPRYRRICIEAAAKDHVIHLETITLAEEQEAPNATAVGQILISSRELWTRWKNRLLNSFLRCSRNGSIVGYQIAFANAAPASFC